MGIKQPEYQELTDRSALRAEEKATLEQALRAKHAVVTELEAMRAEDKILMLSGEEERMLRAFRAFRLRCKPGGVFKWQTVPETDPEILADGVLEATETGLISDPRDVSGS